MRRLAKLALALALSSSSGCSCGWGCGVGSLEIGGDHPYRRCLMDDPPEAEERAVDGARIEIDSRTLRIEFDADEVRISFVSDLPADVSALEAVAAALKERSVGLVVVLGGLGEEEEALASALAALATSGAPVLVLAGGADDHETLEDALDELDDDIAERVVDVGALRRVELLGQVFVPIAGAPDGRYALGEGYCGFSEADLEEVADDVGEPVADERRWLISWAAPTGEGPRSPSLGYADVEAGSAALRALAERVGAEGGVHAWPRARALLPTDAAGEALLRVGEASPSLRITLPPLGGPPVERADGSRVSPQALVFLVTPDGMALIDSVRVPGN